MYTMYSKTETNSNGTAKVVADCPYSKDKVMKIFSDGATITDIFPNYDSTKHVILKYTTLDYPIVEDGVVREMNRYEKYVNGIKPLADGEVLDEVTQTIEEIPAPIDGGTYTWVDGVWTLNMEVALADLITEIETEKSNRRDTGFVYLDIYHQKVRSDVDVAYAVSIKELFEDGDNLPIIWYPSNAPRGIEFNTTDEFKVLADLLITFNKALYKAESQAKIAAFSATSDNILDIDVSSYFDDCLSEFNTDTENLEVVL